jgi:two-component system cell cycle sensor histidine kinase/response regulator CckA
MTLADGPLPVKADRGQLEQVLINLVTNARDAMPDGGVLVVSTRRGMADGDADLPAGAYAVLSVTDTGTGMDRQTRERAFEPFFTTKEVGRGTGLGLATVYGIVSQSGGRVTVHSAPGEGSGFDVHLPITTEKDTGETRALLPGAMAGGMVLLAEDEPQVRAATAQMLHLAGYQVLTARDGADALERARAFPGPIDVLVSDVVMRHMGGVELARQLLAERPALRVLFISGYPAGAEIDPLPPDVGPCADFLHKPFTFEALTTRLARLLAAGSTSLPPSPSRPQPGR